MTKLLERRPASSLKAKLHIAAVLALGPIAVDADDWKFDGKRTRDISAYELDLGYLNRARDEDTRYISDDSPVDWTDHDSAVVLSSDWLEERVRKRAAEFMDQTTTKIQGIGSGKNPYRTDTAVPPLPADVKPWWEDSVLRQLGTNTKPTQETPGDLLVRALAYSSQIKVFSDVPVIRETAELEAHGRFDLTAYLDYRVSDLDEPVGNTLKTGGPDRFFEDEWVSRAGFRKTFVTGTEFDVSQRWGVLNNNSEFLDPKDQANTRFAITLTQPLLNGFGVRYNRSLIDVAQIDGSVARDEYRRQVESHLLELIRSYWGLYLERAALVQRRALVRRTEKMAQTIEARARYDVSAVQARRVRSELLARQAQVVRAESAVRNAESRIVSLINDPSLSITNDFELIPAMRPVTAGSSVTPDIALALALENRPEVGQAFKQLKASAIRVNMTKRELLPVLNLVLGFSRDGLAGDRDVSVAFSSAWDVGDGSWTVGLIFEYPLSNRKAKARYRRRQAEARQLANQLRTTTETIMLEVQVSVRELDTAHREMQTKYAAFQAGMLEVKSLEERQGVELTDGRSGVVYLELLLDAQDRLSESEYGFLTSQVSYNIALANLDRATGMLLQTYDIRPRWYEDSDPEIDDLPGYGLEKVRTAAVR